MAEAKQNISADVVIRTSFSSLFFIFVAVSQRKVKAWSKITEAPLGRTECTEIVVFAH